MTKEMFAEKMAETLRSIEGVTSVEIRPIQKNNGVELIGVIPKNDNSNVFPSIYAESYFERYEKGEDIDSLMNDLVKTYEEHKVNIEVDISIFTDYDKVKDKIVPRIINSKSNENFLKDVPHRMIGDLAVIYNILLSKNEEGTSSTTIHNNLLTDLGVTEEELFKVSVDNIKQLKPQFIDMAFAIARVTVPGFKDMSKEEQKLVMEDITPSDSNSPMFIITNEECNYGASSILDKDTMNKVYERVGECYILPSSVHELVVVPKNSESPSVEMLRNLVKEINTTQVPEQSVLSDNVYLYDGEFKVA